MKYNAVKWFFLYLKERIRSIGLLLFFTFIYAVVFYLSRAKLEAVLYAGLLCLFFGLIAMIFDFIHFYRHQQNLIELQNLSYFDLSKLPEPRNLTQVHYQKLIRLLDNRNRKSEMSFLRSQSEMIEYYTMWVHQIKTPISAMRLLLQGQEKQENAQLLSELFKIEQYVQMVLSYLRLDGSNDFVIQKYDLESIVKQAVRKYASLFIHQKIKLDLKPIDAEVLTDEKWLAFVLEQLLSNALKYTRQGTISIYMASETKLVIEDSGIGISPEDLPRMGEKGFTGYNGREQKQATGLGLYLCKKVMKRLSHTINFESEIGRGTKVILGFDTLTFFSE